MYWNWMNWNFFAIVPVINGNMGCIEIQEKRFKEDNGLWLMETWDVLKFDLKKEIVELEQINGNMGCIEIEQCADRNCVCDGLIEIWDVLKLYTPSRFWRNRMCAHKCYFWNKFQKCLLGNIPKPLQNASGAFCKNVLKNWKAFSKISCKNSAVYGAIFYWLSTLLFRHFLILIALSDGDTL